jgi:hypothetical protein
MKCNIHDVIRPVNAAAACSTASSDVQSLLRMLGVAIMRRERHMFVSTIKSSPYIDFMCFPRFLS